MAQPHPDHTGDHHHDHHDHDGDDGHRHVAEVLPPPSGPGTVVVDIGGDIGAAVVTTPASLDGEEIEIRPQPGAWEGRHVAVRARPMPQRTIYAAMFESLTAGDYVVRVRFGPHGATELPLTVEGGRVVQVSWPEA